MVVGVLLEIAESSDIVEKDEQNRYAAYKNWIFLKL